jgi:hypothetical protein
MASNLNIFDEQQLLKRFGIPDCKLPITYDILLDICSHLQKGIFSVYTDILIETASIIVYFGFLRRGEFTVNIEFDTECNLCLEDIRMSNNY